MVHYFVTVGFEVLKSVTEELFLLPVSYLFLVWPILKMEAVCSSEMCVAFNKLLSVISEERTLLYHFI
jgi:hypothetical protein